jgi:hypothetical protein
MIFLVLEIAAACLAIVMFTGTGWLIRQRRRNDQTAAEGYPIGDEHASRDGRGRFIR